MDETSNLTIRFANESNNTTYTTYNTAWADIISLDYDLLENLTGL